MYVLHMEVVVKIRPIVFFQIFEYATTIETIETIHNDY